ncbi:hypothetical protein MTBBW1_2200032 [Desulfamplus magnetovallimortis]|uniref:Uncharacterized protein n=1 Tax=Desulfamplus magnetovallimortis TaxID=1246637 RepID=A0A1W1HDD0_9BACT|nr:type II secretion system protein [Desulfamplus magnetovallimortis]SLM30378.1 hypothetical protein MTBBW1_2200032 [Desulfamplus magnetovallimortis]
MQNENAYTLIEVTVALVIIGISITAVTGALSSAKSLSARADHAVEAIRVLKNIVNNPGLMVEIAEEKSFEGNLESETGWICRAESVPLVVNSSDMLLTGSEEDTDGEEIEVEGMLSVTICVVNLQESAGKEYCIHRWVREP